MASLPHWFCRLPQNTSVSLNSPRGLLSPSRMRSINFIDEAEMMMKELERESSTLIEGNPALPGNVLRPLLTSLVDQVPGGALLVFAPTTEIHHILWEYTDDGYFRRRLERAKIYDVMDHAVEFGQALGGLSAHEHGDRWPSAHPDADARGKPKDGGWWISTTGKVRLAAAKFTLFPCPFAWPEVGTRHSAALAVAYSLTQGVVLVVSECQTLHAITASGAQQGMIHRATLIDTRKGLCNQLDNIR